MKGYKYNIIEDFVSTTLISEDPQEVLENAIGYIIDLADSSEDDAFEYLYSYEKNIKIRSNE